MGCQTKNQNMQSNFSELRRADRQSCWNTPLDRKATVKNLDKFLGCLVGGAAGDALGYAVKFLPERAIFSMYYFKKKELLPRVKMVPEFLRSIQPESLLDVASGRSVFLFPFLTQFPWIQVTAGVYRTAF